MHKSIGRYVTLSVVLCLSGACIEPNTTSEPELVDVSQAVRPPVCEDHSAPMDELLSFVNDARNDFLDDAPHYDDAGLLVRSCGLRSDLAWELSHHGRFQCLDELADVAGMGEGAWRQVLGCAHASGHAIGLKYVFDQDTTPHDITVAFSTAQSDQTELFINEATRGELMAIDGIGATLAGRVIAHRPLNLFWLNQLDGIGVNRIRSIKAAAEGWTPTEELTVWVGAIEGLPPELAAIAQAEMDMRSPGCDPIEPQPGCIFSVEFDEAYVSYVNGEAVEYEVHASQWVDPDGGMKLWYTFWYDANFNLVQDDVLI